MLNQTLEVWYQKKVQNCLAWYVMVELYIKLSFPLVQWKHVFKEIKPNFRMKLNLDETGQGGECVKKKIKYGRRNKSILTTVTKFTTYNQGLLLLFGDLYNGS